MLLIIREFLSTLEQVLIIESDVEDPSLYQSYSARYAQSFNDKFAFKVNASYLRANDFVGEDFRDQSGLIERGGTSRETAAIPSV